MKYVENVCPFGDGASISPPISHLIEKLRANYPQIPNPRRTTEEEIESLNQLDTTRITREHLER